jgi:hypothetical protein
MLRVELKRLTVGVIRGVGPRALARNVHWSLRSLALTSQPPIAKTYAPNMDHPSLSVLSFNPPSIIHCRLCHIVPPASAMHAATQPYNGLVISNVLSGMPLTRLETL